MKLMGVSTWAELNIQFDRCTQIPQGTHQGWSREGARRGDTPGFRKSWIGRGIQELWDSAAPRKVYALPITWIKCRAKFKKNKVISKSCMCLVKIELTHGPRIYNVCVCVSVCVSVYVFLIYFDGRSCNDGRSKHALTEASKSYGIPKPP